MRYIGALYSIKNIMSSEIEGYVIENRFPIKRYRSKSPISNSTTKANYVSRPTRESSSSRERRKPKKCCLPNRGKKKEGRRKERRNQERKKERKSRKER